MNWTKLQLETYARYYARLIDYIKNNVIVSDYTHPETHPASMITEDEDRNFVSTAQKSNIHAPHSDDQDLSGKADVEHNHTGTYEPANSNIQTHVTSPHAPSDAQKNSDITKAEIEAKLTGVISSHSHSGGSEAFPIGSVFISVVATNPNTLLGYGTWSAFSTGRVLVGIDSGDTDFNTVEKTGGSKTSTPSSHTGTAVADHAAKNTGSASAGSTQRGTTSSTVTIATHTHQVSAYTHSVTQPSNHSAISIVQPYIVVYMWKRTA